MPTRRSQAPGRYRRPPTRRWRAANRRKLYIIASVTRSRPAIRSPRAGRRERRHRCPPRPPPMQAGSGAGPGRRPARDRRRQGRPRRPAGQRRGRCRRCRQRVAEPAVDSVTGPAQPIARHCARVARRASSFTERSRVVAVHHRQIAWIRQVPALPFTAQVAFERHAPPVVVRSGDLAVFGGAEVRLVTDKGGHVPFNALIDPSSRQLNGRVAGNPPPACPERPRASLLAFRKRLSANQATGRWASHRRGLSTSIFRMVSSGTPR